jgi:hypothetical protein
MSEPPPVPAWTAARGRSVTGPLRRLGVWLFRNRRSGGIAIAQLPNLALWGFLVALLVRWILPLSSHVREVVDVIAVAFLAWWSVDEVVRGVNPWRRILGSIVGALVAVMFVSRLR